MLSSTGRQGCYNVRMAGRKREGECPRQAYHLMRDESTVQGLVYKGERVIVLRLLKWSLSKNFTYRIRA